MLEEILTFTGLIVIIFFILGEEDHREFADQKSRLVKLLYPNGYSVGINEEKKLK